MSKQFSKDRVDPGSWRIGMCTAWLPETLNTDSHLITVRMPLVLHYLFIPVSHILFGWWPLLAQNTILQGDSSGCTLYWCSNGFGCSAILPSCLALKKSQSVKLKCTSQRITMYLNQRGLYSHRSDHPYQILIRRSSRAFSRRHVSRNMACCGGDA